MPTGRKDSFRWLLPRAPQRRLVYKNGDCNITRANINKRSQRYLADIFTTLVDLKWRWNLLIFALAFTLSWVIFGLVWWLICFAHGDLDHAKDDHWKPCVQNVVDFQTALLFSIETQQTIGYGLRCMNPYCAEAIIMVMFQSIFGIILQALMTGLVFAKLSRPKKRAQTLLFSKSALVCERDGELCLLFRVGDMRKSHIVEAQVRAIFISKRVTDEGEDLALYQRDLPLGNPAGDGRLFLVWPVIVEHRITSESPLWEISGDDLHRRHFEIVVILEGIVESTGMTTQARTSYLPAEVLWGHRFERLVRYKRETGQYLVDYSKFNNITAVEEMSRASAKDRAAGVVPDREKGHSEDSDDDAAGNPAPAGEGSTPGLVAYPVVYPAGYGEPSSAARSMSIVSTTRPNGVAMALAACSLQKEFSPLGAEQFAAHLDDICQFEETI
jgi:potassium inwardly-rectifying channel subfamily J